MISFEEPPPGDVVSGVAPPMSSVGGAADFSVTGAGALGVKHKGKGLADRQGGAALTCSPPGNSFLE